MADTKMQALMVMVLQKAFFSLMSGKSNPTEVLENLGFNFEFLEQPERTAEMFAAVHAKSLGSSEVLFLSGLPPLDLWEGKKKITALIVLTDIESELMGELPQKTACNQG